MLLLRLRCTFFACNVYIQSNKAPSVVSLGGEREVNISFEAAVCLAEKASAAAYQ